jgi:hypothetical protein
LGVSTPKAPRVDNSQVQLAMRPAQAPVTARARTPTGLQPPSRQPTRATEIPTVQVKARETVQAPAVQARGFVETQPSLNMLAALGIARHRQKRDDYHLGIIMVGSKAQFGETQKASEIFDHLIADSCRSVAISDILQV